VHLVLVGTVIALIPNSQAVKLSSPARVRVAQAHSAMMKAGETVGAGD